jgi:hypothetical protein
LEQWLFTFDSATGRVCRVEKLDPLSGKRQELSQPEYAALDNYLSALIAESYPAAHTDPALASRTVATQKAYLQGVADCAALYRQYGLFR